MELISFGRTRSSRYDGVLGGASAMRNTPRASTPAESDATRHSDLGARLPARRMSLGTPPIMCTAPAAISSPYSALVSTGHLENPYATYSMPISDGLTSLIGMASEDGAMRFNMTWIESSGSRTLPAIVCRSARKNARIGSEDRRAMCALRSIEEIMCVPSAPHTKTGSSARC